MTTIPLPSTTAHLRAVFGQVERGYICTTRVDDKIVRSACWTPEELDKAATWCSLASREGANVYVRMTTLAARVKAHERGSADQSDALVALWGDLDCAGPGHKPAVDGLELPADFAALNELICDIDLPPSLVLNTGGGYQTLWLLDRPRYLDTDEQRSAAKTLSKRWSRSLQEHGRRRGWHVDAVGDLPRMLRVAGTKRRKPGCDQNVVTVEYCGDGWPPGLAIEPNWRPGPVYTVADIEAAIVEPTRRIRQRPAPEDRPTPRPVAVQSELGPADAIRAALTWAEILEPAGYTYAGNDAATGGDRWLRPGDPSSDHSLKTFGEDGACTIWSSAIGLPIGEGVSKFDLWAHLHFGPGRQGQVEAGRALRRRRQEIA